MTLLRRLAPLSLVACAGLAFAGCDTGTRHPGPSGSTAAGVYNALTPTPATSPTTPAAASPAAAPAASSSGLSVAGTSSASLAAASTTSAVGSASTAAAATSASPAPAAAAPVAATPTPAAAPAPAAPTGPQIWGTLPPDPTTGFDGTLYLVGEQLVPGSVISVEVNGVWTKFLPATFYSSELLGVYVYLTVPADYTFTAVAPDGTLSTPVTFTVPSGSLSALMGLNPPAVQMVYPPHLDTDFTGTLWLLGDQFMPGSVVTISDASGFAQILPLQFVNERTVGLPVLRPFSGDFTIQVSNPTLLSSGPVTVTVGAPTPGSNGVPSFSAPSRVSSPFVGTVHLTGTDLDQGAVAELRDAAGNTISRTPLLRISSQEAWWTLAYPQRGDYEVRVVNPTGAASPWSSFRVD